MHLEWLVRLRYTLTKTLLAQNGGWEDGRRGRERREGEERDLPNTDYSQ